MLNVSFAFAPASVEVLKPDREYRLKPGDIQAIALNVATISVDYSHYILERVLNKDDIEKVKDDIKRREELGRKFLEKKDEKK